MKLIKLISLVIPALLVSCLNGEEKHLESQSEITELNWRGFDQSIFNDAKGNNKLVLLNIGANWCHWCHVMDDSTYSNPKVQNLLNSNFILAHEDQDSRADLFAKYRSYGWPATIVFNSNGEELLKLRGYQSPKKFMALLENTIKNPTVIEQQNEFENYSPDAIDTSNTRELITQFNALVDSDKGSLKSYKKSLYKPSINFAFQFYKQSDSLKDWLNTSIKKSYQLLDPVWGGVYQYATHYDWKNAHYEKILRIQAEYMDSYAIYGYTFNDTMAINNAEKIYHYSNRFLSSNSPLFDNSQDADYLKGIESTQYYKLDDEERTELGIPAVNEKQFLKENALMAKALVNLWLATNNDKYIQRAQGILEAITRNYKAKNGLYKRNPDDDEIYSLEDNLALVDAFTIAHQVSGNEDFLIDAENLTNSILKNFKNDNNILLSNCGNLIVESPILPSSNYEAVLALNKLGQILKNENLIQESKELFTNIYKSEFSRSEYYIPYLLMSKNWLETEQFHAVWISDKLGSKLEFDLIKSILKITQQRIIIERVDLNNLSETAKPDIFLGVHCTEQLLQTPYLSALPPSAQAQCTPSRI